ncbi:secretin N-terminal domain-containing protein [Botrimarina sp.]|uniref:secretin N-terminal domain-containing protein n=1 Tax=Botrimarina sp. TaxID=2795802 RepID=UPI0032ECDCBB
MPVARLAAVMLFAAGAFGGASVASGAETEMVGVLAVAIEPETAEKLGLSDEQVAQIVRVIDRRELKGISEAMRLARLPRDERVAEFAPFRAESERQGLASLTAEQAERLRKLAAERDDPALQPTGGPSDERAEPTNAAAAAQPADTPQTESLAEPAEPAGPDETPQAPQPAASEEAAAPDDDPADTPPTTTAPADTPPTNEPSGPAASDGKLTFSFQQQPWGEVIRWFAERADLSLVVDTVPEGTLTYRDTRPHTPAEALDVLNGVLLTKGYTLVRKDRMLLVIDLEQDLVPPNVVTDVPVGELDQRGEYELVRVLVELGQVDPAAAADSVQRLAGPQGRVVVLPEARLLQVTETAGRIRTMLRVVEAMKQAAEPALAEEAELRSYALGGADGETALAVLQTLLEGAETTRLAVDDQTASLIALATPKQHAAIEATLQKLRTDGRRVELIRTDTIDPLAAAALVTRMFDPDAADEKRRDPNAPVIQADPITESVLVRGTDAQIAQVRQLIADLDTPAEARQAASGGAVRTIPLSGLELEQALQRIDAVWPSLRENPLRVTGPSGRIPSFRPGADVQNERETYDFDSLFDDRFAPPADDEPGDTPDGRTTSGLASPFRLAGQDQPPQRRADDQQTTPRPDAPPVFISPGLGSTLIASSDTDALDALEQLLAQVANSAAAGSRQYAVFYLKFADAKTAASLLDSLFGGGGSAGGGSLLGDLAGAAIGGEGGDMMGDLLGLAGGSDAVGFSSVSVDITPDVRLNALYVYATPSDLQTVNQMLRLIDQPRGPDRVESYGVPRLIPLENTSATDVVEVVRQVFTDRLEGSGGAGGQPSPQEMLRALAGAEGQQEQEPERMQIGVDERSNSIVVRSSEQLFDEVRTLVEQLDRAGVERPVATRVVSLRNTGSDALRQTLVSLLGDKAVVAGAPAAAPQTPGAPPAGAGQPPGDRGAEQNAERSQREMQERVERFQQMRRALERMRGEGGGGGGGRGRGGGGRGGRGGGPGR